MPLLVVPLAASEAGWLTLDEWDALRACERVVFERADHPLAARLARAGVAVAALDGEPDAGAAGGALVADPDSELVVRLARAGASVTAGAARPPDALTAAHGAVVARRAASSLATAALVMARLRSPDGCPWDREQTHESLQVHLLEEAHEVIDAIEHGAVEAELREELGDLLMQVAFHAQLAADDGRFDVADVADAIVAKLVHRHPHVFADVEVSDAAEVVTNWEALKRAEKERTGPFDDIPRSLPALLWTYKAQKRAAALGFRADADDAARRARAAVDAGDVGDALFWVVAVARARGLDPEGALRRAATRWRGGIAAE
ncbi:MAG TPA: MazG family protein [Actinomycetota bacterium]|nr:MazG family protein [Actinomycetota bacterium]